MVAEPLSSDQAHALLDILSHAEMYQEIRNFREPGSLEKYGPPFIAPKGTPSNFPALQTLVSRFLLNLPGLKDLTTDFWKVQCRSIIGDLERADLSESYEKGILGSRKTLATAVSALIEYPVRGTYGGFEKLTDPNHDYDTGKAEDLSRAFRDFMNESIYGNILDELVAKAAATDKLSEHEAITQGVHEFVLVNLASFMHYTVILSPKGQYLLKLVDNANKLVPYMVIRQTLKIGNVASMISAMTRVVLAKMSVTSVTNWMGLTQSADDGMNLMQHIISTVLLWDIKELESRALKIEKDRAAAGQEQLHALKKYVSRSREDHENLRHQSERESKSIVTVILEDEKLSSQMTDTHHKQALEYLSVQLSIRDRKEIVQVLCHSQPDHLTQSVRELVAAYEPVIRNVHNAVDLSETVGDFEHFLRDMIKMSRIHPGKDGHSVVPTVGDFIQLLRKHQYSCHKFVHQCCKNGKEVTNWYLEWARTAASHFRRDHNPESGEVGAGDLTKPLNEQFAKLPEEMQKIVLSILDEQTHYLIELHAASSARLTTVLKSPPSTNPAIAKIFSAHHLSRSLPGSRSTSRATSPDRSRNEAPPDSNCTPTVESDPGPGAFLARWQSLLDSTLITPAKAEGPVRHGGNAEVVNSSTADVDGEQMVEIGKDRAGERLAKILAKKGKGQRGKRPNVQPVLDAMLPGFREMLAQLSCDW